jgi:hypothetical protein
VYESLCVVCVKWSVARRTGATGRAVAKPRKGHGGESTIVSTHSRHLREPARTDQSTLLLSSLPSVRVACCCLLRAAPLRFWQLVLPASLCNAKNKNERPRKRA